MTLTVAVQMDPLDSINIAGDSTFALMLSAQARGHRLFHYGAGGPELGRRPALDQAHPVTVQRVAGDHFTFGDPVALDLGEEADVILMRQDPPFDLGYITATHLLERIADRTLVVNDPAQVRNAPEKVFVLDYPQFMPPTLVTRSLDEARAFLNDPRRDRGEAAPRQRRQGDLQGRAGRPEPVGAVRSLQPDLARTAYGAGVPARGGQGRQAHRPGRRRGRRRDQPPARRGRNPQQPRGRRLGREDRTDRSRARNLRRPRPRTEEARAAVRRHRRDRRRMADRDQRHQPDRHRRDRALRRHRRGRA